MEASPFPISPKEKSLGFCYAESATKDVSVHLSRGCKCAEWGKQGQASCLSSCIAECRPNNNDESLPWASLLLFYIYSPIGKAKSALSRHCFLLQKQETCPGAIVIKQK